MGAACPSDLPKRMSAPILHWCRRRLVREERGFTMIELMVSVMILSTGIVALVGALDMQRDLVGVAERKEAITHVAEREMEKVLALPHEEVVLSADPEQSSDPNHPGYYVNAAQRRFQWDRDNSARVENLVDPQTGGLAPESDWSTQGMSGKVHRYVTWGADSDGSCQPAGSCPNGAYKRVTVAVTLAGPKGPRRPTLVSALVIDPTDGPSGSDSSPQSECINEEGELETCNTAGDPFTTWHLYDTNAKSHSTRQAIAGDHATHPTVAPFTSSCPTTGTSGDTSGCPEPDLLGTSRPPVTTPAPPLLNYSTDAPATNPLGGTWPGGRVLRADTSCSGTPVSPTSPGSDGGVDANTSGAFWVTPTLDAPKTLNGKGGLSLYTQTLSGTETGATLCLAFYEVPGDVSNLVSTATRPTEIGRTSFTLSNWPTDVTPVSFAFDFRGASGNYTIASGKRIGMRLWLAPGGGADISLAYDHESYDSFLQLNEAGS
jgi:prepilin-type N-terminal cleavage/methylation domain-containing protein